MADFMDYTADGNTLLDADEREGLKLPHVQTRGELDQLEQQNIQDAYRWLSRQRKYRDVLTAEFLQALHLHMFEDVWRWAGCFRTSEKNIGVHPGEISAATRNLLEDARFWAEHHTYTREEFAVRFHHRLAQIHPFPNGNGRHSRIMTDVILEKALNAATINWSGDGSVDAETHRQNYIAALRAADSKDYGLLIRFVSA